jgi:CRP-like cAMP-binding protein
LVRYDNDSTPLAGGTLIQAVRPGEDGMTDETVIALSDVECYRLDKEAFNEIIKHYPEIAEDISEQLAHRRVELDAAREG